MPPFFHFPFKFISFNHRGDYDRESITFQAEEDIDSLYDFLLIYSIEDEETGLPVYEKTRILSFPEVELQKGSLLEIFTCKGEDSTSIDYETAVVNQRVYWGLPAPIWSVPRCSFELMPRSDSIGGAPYDIDD